jgi:transcriptional regulator with XRE-family HTH domain
MPGRGDFAPSGFGARLRAIREGKEMTQKEVAEKAGTHANTIARLERGEQEPAWPLVIAIAGALGVDCTAFTEVQAPAPQKKHRGGKK